MVLRIVHYHPRLRLADGGFARAILDTCSVLARRGNEVVLVTTDQSDVPADWDGGCGTPRVVRVGQPGAFGMLGPGALEVLREEIRHATAVHLHEVWLPSNSQVAGLCQRLDVPYVFTLHGMLDDWSLAQRSARKQLFLMLFGGRVLAGAAAIHCTAEAERQQVRRRTGNDRITVLPYIVDLSIFHSLPGPDLAKQAFPALGPAGPKVLFLSRLHPKKGLELLIEALAALRRQGLTVTGVVAGRGDAAYEASLRRLCADRGIGDDVCFVGQVAGATKLSLYQAADMLVLPTSQENFGLVLIESLACGTPVMTTRGVDIWDELEQGGAVITERSVEAVAAAIRRMIATPGLRDDLGRRGREWVFATLDSDRLGVAYEQLYTSLAGQHPRSLSADRRDA